MMDLGDLIAAEQHPEMITCPSCDGAGQVLGAVGTSVKQVECERCDGLGTIWNWQL